MGAQERARIAALGGRVEMRGCWRVMIAPPAGPARGLAVSRAIGDIDWKVSMWGEIDREREREGDIDWMALRTRIAATAV